MNKIERWSEQIPKPEPPNSNTIYSCTFSPDGSMLFVTIADIIVVYNADTGDILSKPTKAAKETINCIAFARDGRFFATGSNDRTAVVWRYNPDSDKKLDPVVKVTLSDAVLTLCFNPMTHQLFCGGAADMALYSVTKKDVPKEKYKEKIICSAWSPDGQTLAFGTVAGTLALRQRSLEEKNEIKLDAPIWCMEWSPVTSEHDQSYLLVGCWNQTFYYFDHEGEKRERYSERHIVCNPISISFHPSGEYFLMTGTDRKLSLYSRDLGHLTDVCTLEDWSWCSKFRPKVNEIGVTTNSGYISVQSIAKVPTYSTFHELYARTDNFTDVIVQNIALNQKLRLKCKELVRRVSLFKDKLAVLQNDRLLIYVAGQQGLKYSPFRKITKKFECDQMEILNSNVLFAHKSRLFAYNFLGDLEREWILDADVTYLRTVGGPSKREHALVGLVNGQVLKVFIDNSFPVQLFRASVAIVKCQLSFHKKRLAILDLNKNLIGYDLITQAQIFQEANVSSFSWNSDIDDSIAFASGGVVSIKSSGLPPLQQKSQGRILNFQGFHLCVLKGELVSVMDISQSSTLVKLVEKKDFDLAYRLACLGVPANDIRFLGVEALQNQDYQTAEKCFTRLVDLPFLELTKKFQEESKTGNKPNPSLIKAEVLAYQGKYQQAASYYMKANKPNDAVQLFIELKRFEQAQQYIKMSGISSEKEAMTSIYEEQAEWALANGEWNQAAQLYMSSKNYKKSIEIYTRELHVEGLIEVCRILDREGNEPILISCANLFKKQKQHSYAKEIYLKMGDNVALMNLHIETEKWEEAFLLGKQNKQLLELAKLPYANYLLKNDKYEDALRAYKKMGRTDLASSIVTSLCRNSVSERRYVDASRHYWSLATDTMKGVSDINSSNPEQVQLLKKFHQYKEMSEIYFVYNSVAEFVEMPFFTSSDSALYMILNACRFLITKIDDYKLPGINTAYIYYSLAKVANKLEGYKTVRACYEKLAGLLVNPKWTEDMELSSLAVRSKPFSDSQTILPTCARCGITNPLITNKNVCISCKHPIIISFMSFEPLPVIEFIPEAGISHTKVLQLLNSEKSDKISAGAQKKRPSGQQNPQNTQVMTLGTEGAESSVLSPVLKKRIAQTLQQQQLQLEYMPLVLNERLLSEMELQCVYFVDMRKMNASNKVRYFINCANEVLLKACNECGKMFLLDEYQFEFIQTKRCPYCHGEEKRSGRTKDIFDL